MRAKVDWLTGYLTCSGRTTVFLFIILLPEFAITFPLVETRSLFILRFVHQKLQSNIGELHWSRGDVQTDMFSNIFNVLLTFLLLFYLTEKVVVAYPCLMLWLIKNLKE